MCGMRDGAAVDGAYVWNMSENSLRRQLSSGSLGGLTGLVDTDATPEPCEVAPAQMVVPSAEQIDADPALNTRSKLARKSMPMMLCEQSAIMNGQSKSRY
ncbi:hypothetical protein Ciccas_013784 [Cichlidogyrus casuarinus]|uniref:Uncharacterized protein n=1 Tax=Cichlidogyrus casuarinus TaxID=1844966 RepID=A0ABD2PJQ4_9PLAT